MNFQINYSTVLPVFDLLQMANDCDEYISTKNCLSDILSNEPPLKCPSSGRGGIHIRSFFFLVVSLFINLVISLSAYLFILIFIHFYFFTLLTTGRPWPTPGFVPNSCCASVLLSMRVDRFCKFESVDNLLHLTISGDLLFYRVEDFDHVKFC